MYIVTYIYIYIYVCVCVFTGFGVSNLAREYIWVALLVYRYLSNTASFVFYDVTCLIRLI